MKKIHARILYVLITLLAAVVYSIILFTLKKEFTRASGVAYAFTLLAFLMLAVAVDLPAAGAKGNILTKILRSKVTAVYFCVQFLFGGVLAMCFDSISWKLVLAAELVILALYLMAVVGLALGGGLTGRQEQAANRKVSALRLLQSDLETIHQEVQDGELKKSIASLAEAVRYSDPISNGELQDLEDRILSNVQLLREDVDIQDNQRAMDRVEKLRRLLEERNRKCRILKHKN